MFGFKCNKLLSTIRSVILRRRDYVDHFPKVWLTLVQLEKGENRFQFGHQLGVSGLFRIHNKYYKRHDYFTNLAHTSHVRQFCMHTCILGNVLREGTTQRQYFFDGIIFCLCTWFAQRCPSSKYELLQVLFKPIQMFLRSTFLDIIT